MLIIEREPRDVNLARALEDARRNIQHGASRRGNNIGLECSIKSLVGTKMVSVVKLSVNEYADKTSELIPSDNLV